jgi:hypothetical protein
MNIPIPHFPASLRPPVWRHPDAAGRDGGTDNISPQERLYRYRLQAWVSPAGQGASGGSSSSPLLTDLVAYWKLDDLTWSDNVGSNHLTNNGGVVLGMPKLGAGSAEFDGGDYLSHVDNPALRLDPVNGFTISVWFYPTTITGRHTIINKWQPGYLLRLNNSDLEFYLNDGSNRLVSISGITTGSWYHAIAWYNPTAQRSYVQLNNGIPIQSGATFVPNVSSASFAIGATDVGTNTFFGRIDDPGKWDRVLTGDERDDLWNGGSGLSYPF